MQYRRSRVPGACYFFTVVAWRRQRVLASTPILPLIGEAMRVVQQTRPFRTDAIVVLPDHLHCRWTLPSGDSDFSTRWSLVKQYVTRRAGAGRIWQPRFWEHLIRGDEDCRHHLEYIHYNPVRHGLVKAPSEWRHSSFHRHVAAGHYPADWGRSEPVIPRGVGRE